MKRRNLLFIVVLLAACLSQFASDIYAPSLSAISRQLHSPINQAQWSMAIYMLGVALSLLFYGPLSEGLGRKWTLVTGLCIMLVGSIMAFFAPSIEALILSRLVQGLGAGACQGLVRAIFRDVFSGDELAKYGSYLMISIVFVVPAAPIIGAYLQHFFGWRSIFIFISLYALITIAVVIGFFKETSQHHHLDRLKPGFIIKSYGQILKSRVFVGMSACSFLTYGAFFAWFTASPVLLIHNLKMTPVTYGWINFIAGGLAYGLSGLLNGRFVTKVGAANMMRFGWTIMLIAGLLMLLGQLFIGVNTWAIFVPAILFFIGSTFIYPNASAVAMTPFGKLAGYAGALYSFMQIAGAAFIGGIISHLPDTNQLPLAVTFIVAAILCWLIYEGVVHRARTEGPDAASHK